MRKLKLNDLRSLDLRRTARRLRDSVLEGWYRKGDPSSEDRKRLVMCNYTSNVIANFVGGTFWTGLLLHLNAGDGFIGTMSMFSLAANMLQCFSPLLLERFPKRRTMLTVLRGVLYFINVILIGLIPLFPADRQIRLYMTGAGVLIVNIINAFISPGLSIWHIQSLPNETRKSYFSLITMTVGAVVAICNLLGGWIVDIFAAHDMRYYGLLTVRAIAAVLCAVEIYLYFHIREYPYESSGDRFTVRELFTRPLHEKKYLYTIAVVFVWNITANVPGSYYTVYLLRNVEMAYSTITLINMLNVPIVLLLTPIWRKVLGKYGWFRTLSFSMSIYALHYFLLAAVTKERPWFYALALMLGFTFAIGINLSFTGIPYVNMPRENQTVFIGFYSTCANLAALVGVTVGKYFILSTQEASVSLGSFVLTNKQLIVVLTGVLVSLAAICIRLISRKVGDDS